MRNILGAAVAAVTFTGCIFGGGDPIEGSWEADVQAVPGCTSEFTIDGCDGDVCTGSGDFCFQDQNTGAPVKCDGAVEFTKTREGEYDVEVDYSGANGCDQLGQVQGECELQKEETELDCGAGVIFNKVEG